ncbi:YolD-like protein [compost metagenome]
MSQRRLEEKRKVQPALDDQELELIQQALAESYNEHREITIRLWGEYEDKVVTGIVTAVQTYRGEVKVSTYENDWEWVRIKDIVAAE